MKKKLLAAAIAGAFAVPGVALADGSSVTISGFFKVGIESYNIGSSVGRANSSEMRLTDNSSRIIFNVKEDLGGGLSAIAQLDTRFNPTTTGGATWGTGNTWVGMHSNDWGNITIGNRDLHYFHTADTIPGGATALDAWSVGILGFVNPDVGGTVKNAFNNVPIASDTRTPNVIEYASPKWGVFDFGLAWSANRAGSPTDMGAPGVATGSGLPVTRKGQAWNFAPEIHTGPWWLGYSYWKSEADPSAATEPDQRSDRIWGFYNFPQGFHVGFTWDKSRINDAANGTKYADRNAWSIPLSYSWGPHSIGWTYTRANDDKVAGSSTGAKLNSVYYQYALSKRTQVAVTYANLNNDSKAAYNLFATGLGSGDVASPLTPGEDPRALQFTLNHSF
ncbi:MAG: porin [Betaproteobacteria bacterium]|nr:porin [Betaproteobacteria bacterium]